MRVVVAPEQAVLDIAGPQKNKHNSHRFLKWTVFVPKGDGFLINNYMSGELIHIGADEFGRYLSEEDAALLSKLVNDTSNDKTVMEKDTDIKAILNKALNNIGHETIADGELLLHLLGHWFMVPVDFDEKKLVEEIRLACKLINRKRGITSYKILPTTRCNARCFYCYEHGIKFHDMTEETADKIIDFIQSHHNGRQVTISWFGGEPLMRPDIISRICIGLSERGIEFASVMISNGYIFNDELVEKAKNEWKLKNIQITLDGTRDVYNKAKNYYSENDSNIYNHAGKYVNEDISSRPYDRVIRNIHKLAENGISVNIRLNLGAYNYKDMDELIDVLGDEFGKNNRVTAYVGGLFEEMEQEEALKKELVNNIIKLSDKLNDKGLTSYLKSGLKLRITGCMADNDNHIGFSPDGLLIKCEHYLDDKTIGHIDREGIDKDVVNEWKEREEDGVECDSCPAFPACYKLKNCPISHACSGSERDEILSENKRTILHELIVADRLKKEAAAGDTKAVSETEDPLEESELLDC